MRILMVLDHSFPPDIRVENEARSLVEAGFEVAVLAIGPDTRTASENFKGITVLRDRVPGKVRDWLRGFSGASSLPHRLLASRIRRAHRQWPCDVLHLHDLYLFGGGLRAAGQLGIPVVGDLHENWVEALKHYAWSTRLPGKLAVSIPRWEKLEAAWVNQVHRLVVVVQEAAGRNEALGVPSERIVEVPNTVRVEDFDAYPVDRDLVDRVRGKAGLTAIYTGGMDIHRGLENAIHAMRKVADSRPDAQLVLVGDGRIRSSLEALVARLALAEQVRFEGWKPQSLIRSYIEAADVCLVPHRRTVHTDATLPHKLFHYMYAGKPVVVTDCKPIARIVREEACGRVVEDGAPDQMAGAILAMGSEPALAARLGAAGRRAVEARWNWGETTKPLVAMYRELAAEANAGPKQGEASR